MHNHKKIKGNNRTTNIANKMPPATVQTVML
jgi:hypothetical protein